MKMFRVSVIGKFSLNTLNKPSMLRLSGVVSSWKNSLKDWICTSRRSGVSARCLILPKLILLCNFVEAILFKTGFFIVRTSNLLLIINDLQLLASANNPTEIGKRTANVALFRQPNKNNPGVNRGQKRLKRPQKLLNFYIRAGFLQLGNQGVSISLVDTFLDRFGSAVNQVL